MKINQIKEQLKLPVVMAPMFLISNPEMVINACKAGIVGTFPALNARTTELLDEWMSKITTELDKGSAAPWAVNFISHRSNKRFLEDLQLIGKHQPPIVITSLGDPSPVVDVVHDYGGLVFSDVINVKFAKKAIEKGSDGLVLVANGAGGHGGTINPIAFVHEIRSFFDGPVMLAGAMSRGEDVLAAEVLGADFAYMGTHFISAAEGATGEDYRQMAIDSSVDDIVYTPAFSGIPANYLAPSIIRSGLDPTNLPEKGKIDFSELGNPNIRAWKDIYGAGQGIGGINAVKPVAEIVKELFEEYTVAQQKIVQRHQAVTKN